MDPIRGYNVRIPESILRKLHYVADYDGRSVNKEILELIKELIKEFEKEHGEIEISE